MMGAFVLPGSAMRARALRRRALACKLREGTVRATGAGWEVAGAADFVAFFTFFEVALEFECFNFLAHLIVPFVVLGLNACLRCEWRATGKADGRCEGECQRQCNNFFHVSYSRCKSSVSRYGLILDR